MAALDVEEGVVEAVRARAAEHGGLHDPRDEPRVRQLHVPNVLHDRLDTRSARLDSDRRKLRHVNNFIEAAIS